MAVEGIQSRVPDLGQEAAQLRRPPTGSCPRRGRPDRSTASWCAAWCPPLGVRPRVDSGGVPGSGRTSGGVSRSGRPALRPPSGF
jgi:hypothetical protein